MAAWLRRVLPSLLLDAALVLAFALPELCSYFRWPTVALYAVFSLFLVRAFYNNPWIWRIVRDRRTRIAHGFEHATIHVLVQQGLPVRCGYTHAHDRFVVVLEPGSTDQHAMVRDAAEAAMRRIRAGERSLAYHPGCGTSDLVVGASLWIAYLVAVVLSQGDMLVFVVAGLILTRIWVASHVALSLLTQRLLTVATDFDAARVLEVHRIERFRGRDVSDETWFEFVVDVRLGGSHGGLVAPGVIA
jgi:hypothetical protein